MTTKTPVYMAPAATTITRATHPDLGDGVLIHEAFGFGTAFVLDVDEAIGALIELRDGQPDPGPKRHTPASIAALTERALTAAGLPLDSVFLTVHLDAGKVSGIGIIGRPEFTLDQAKTLAAAFGDQDPRAAGTKGGLLNCITRGATVQIHHEAKAVAA